MIHSFNDSCTFVNIPVTGIFLMRELSFNETFMLKISIAGSSRCRRHNGVGRTIFIMLEQLPREYVSRLPWPAVAWGSSRRNVGCRRQITSSPQISFISMFSLFSRNVQNESHSASHR